MVALPLLPSSGGGSDDYDALTEQWPERPSRKRAKRAYQRKQGRQIVVQAERLDEPNTARMSKALLAAQRELAEAQAEKEARDQEPQERR